jgi:hypothetical protein
VAAVVPALDFSSAAGTRPIQANPTSFTFR